MKYLSIQNTTSTTVHNPLIGKEVMKCSKLIITTGTLGYKIYIYIFLFLWIFDVPLLWMRGLEVFQCCTLNQLQINDICTACGGGKNDGCDIEIRTRGRDIVNNSNKIKFK